MKFIAAPSDDLFKRYNNKIGFDINPCFFTTSNSVEVLAFCKKKIPVGSKSSSTCS